MPRRSAGRQGLTERTQHPHDVGASLIGAVAPCTSTLPALRASGRRQKREGFVAMSLGASLRSTDSPVAWHSAVMSDRQARPASWWPVRARLRGLAVGVASAATAAAVAFAIIALSPANTAACDSDLVCLPDLGPALLAITAMPLVIAIVGPMAAYLLGASRPGFFAVPAAWATVLACVGTGPADGQDRWPFNDAVSSVTILLLPYCLIALWAFRQQTTGSGTAHADDPAPEQVS